jgi:hypothetical protein
MTDTTYKLHILDGTLEYVLKELLEKYPQIDILNTGREEIEFEIDMDGDIEIFRNLYSPLHIEDCNGRILKLSKREWR